MSDALTPSPKDGRYTPPAREYPLMPDVFGVPFDEVEAVYLVGGQHIAVRAGTLETLDVRCAADSTEWYLVWQTRAFPVRRHTGADVTDPPVREHRVRYSQIAGVSRTLL